MIRAFLDQMFKVTDAEYQAAIARQENMDTYVRNALPHLVKYARQWQKFTVAAITEDVRPYVWPACLVLNSLVGNVEDACGGIKNGKFSLQRTPGRRSEDIGFLVVLSKLCNEHEFGIVTEYYESAKDRKGIAGVLYMSVAPVEVRSINGNVHSPQARNGI